MPAQTDSIPAVAAGSQDDYIAATTRRAIELFESLQPWPDQFRRRALEMRSLCRLHDLSQARRVLELGCGNAFGSALLAQGRDRVVATDLPSESVETHSIGLKKARDLLDQLELGWCEVLPASAEALPFPDRSFDMIFSLFVLEHVPGREACLDEMHRVLDTGGLSVHGVPGFMWSLEAPLHFQVYLLKRCLARLTRRRPAFDGIHAGGGATKKTEQGLGMWRLFRTRYPHFPIPPPHAAYRNYFHELVSYTRRSWVELFTRHGFEVLECRPLMVLPLDTFSAFLGRYGIAIYERLFAFDQLLAKWVGLRRAGQFFGIVARKRD